MAVSGTNYGSVFQGTYGTTSAVTGSAPTDVTTPDGQPMDGLYAITLVVSSASGTTLSGAGTLQCYILDYGMGTTPGPQTQGSAASSTGTTIVLNETVATDGFVVGQTVRGLKSGATGVVTSVASSTLTCSGGVTGVVIANETIVGFDPGRWTRAPSYDSGTVPSGNRDALFAANLLYTPRKGYIIWIPNGVTFSAGSAGVTVSQLGQTYTGLHNSGAWGG